MTATNLQDVLDQSGSTVELLRNSQLGTYIYPVVPSEFTNFRREVTAWQQTAVLFDQSHHMTNLWVSGADALKLFTDTGINSTATFAVDSAKQFVPVAPNGGVIGDGILFRLAEDRFVYVGRAPVANWLMFHAETGGYDVDVRNDPRSPSRPYGKQVTRDVWRFQIQGPRAWEVIEKVNGGTVDKVKFFRMGTMTIAGEEIRTLRHGMAGAPGLEIWGPTTATTRSARRSWRPARSSVWSPPARGPTAATPWSRAGSPPAAGDLRRRGAAGLPRVAARAGLRGHQRPGRQLRVGRHHRLLHQPVGAGVRQLRQVRPRLHRPRRLEAIDPAAQRRKVTLAWNADDVAELLASPVRPGPGYQFFDLPNANYGSSNFDSVLDADGTVVGLSMFTGYSANERTALSLATVAPDVPLGAEVTVVWGEPDGGSRKTTVEPHEQFGSGPSSARPRTPRWRGRPTSRAGAPPPPAEPRGGRSPPRGRPSSCRHCLGSTSVGPAPEVPLVQPDTASRSVGSHPP